MLPDKGRVVYINHNDKTTSWDPPGVPGSPAEVKDALAKALTEAAAPEEPPELDQAAALPL